MPRGDGKKRNGLLVQPRWNTQAEQWPCLVSRGQSPTCAWDGAGVSLTVVTPGCPHSTAALFLGDVLGQDTVTQANITDVVVALLALCTVREVSCVCLGAL